MEMTCDVLNIFLTTNKTIQRITAEKRVIVVNKQDKSRATGDRAIYIVNPNQEIVQLLGHPRWSDGQRTGTADVFVFDRQNNIFRAKTNAVFKLPREQIGEPGLLSSGTSSTNVQPGKLVEISADTISFKLPQTNSPLREIVAENQVVIASESDQSRATADKAVYNEGTGIVQLTGEPVWKIAQGEIKASVLAIGRTNQFFSARTNVYMKFPAKLFANSLKVDVATNASPATNRWVEIFCDNFLYATNHARLDGNVRANLLDENGSLTTLLCGLAEISFGLSNQVETVSAERNVILQELPGATLQTNLLKKAITCDVLRVKRSVETGLLESLHAEKKVVGEEIEKTKLGETLKRISAEIVDVKFSATTNQIQSVIAKDNVFAEKIERVSGTNKTVQARGEKAVYQWTDEQESVELVGDPSAWTDSILLSDAKLIRWNLKTGKLGAIPYKVTPLNSTNQNLLEMLKRKK
jgi:lipopolysaccharide export system protein LptA